MRAVSRLIVGVLFATSLVALDVVALPAVPALACNDLPIYCDPVDGTIHDGTGNGAVVQVPGDPSPNAPGIWLGNTVTPAYCYANQNRFFIDGDKDWLHDDCELALARAFAPVMLIHPEDGCPAGEPYWAAKYFNDDPVDFVRIMYMPAYYRDCGQRVWHFGGPHAGDSEFVMIGVRHNPVTRHWEVQEAYLSAHATKLTDSSQYVSNPGMLEYPTRELAYPRIWVNRAKHGNYISQDECGDGGAGFDECRGNTAVGRLRVYRNRNVGSRFVDAFPNGVPAQNPAVYDVYLHEYFWSDINFKGWQRNYPDGVESYAYFLNRAYFECALISFVCNFGEGPNPPTSYQLSGIVDGPHQVASYQSTTWTTFVTGGSLPYQATWWRQFASETTPVLLGTSASSGAAGPFTAGSMAFNVGSRCEPFKLIMKVTGADNQTVTDEHPVTVVCGPSIPPPPPVPLSVQIDGPPSIESTGTYTFTAVTSGANGPSYGWSERFCDDQEGLSCAAWVQVGGTGATFNRTLKPDCSGTGQKTFWVGVAVTNADGQTAASERYSALCGLA